MNFFVWLITAFGLSQILVYSKQLEPFRNWLEPRSKWLSELFSCMMCTGTWVGFALSLTCWSPTFECHVAPESISWFLDGMFASGGVWIINTFVSHFDGE
jgi:hypothetical protein